MTFNKALRWAGTALCLVGIALTSVNVYPLNLWWGMAGSACWALAAIGAGDVPLVVVEGVAVVVYATGLLYWLAL